MPAAVLEKLAPEAVTPADPSRPADAPTRVIPCHAAPSSAHITLTQYAHIGTGADAAVSSGGGAFPRRDPEREGEIVSTTAAQGSNVRSVLAGRSDTRPTIAGFAPASWAFTEDSPAFILLSLRAVRSPQRLPLPEMFFGSLGSMPPLVLMFVVLYCDDPPADEAWQKEHKARPDAPQKGDEVSLYGGLIVVRRQARREHQYRRGRQRCRDPGAACRPGRAGGTPKGTFK